MKRITTIVGAGAVLDLDLPAGIMHPSTKNITDSVRELRKKNILSGKDIIEIEESLGKYRKTYWNMEILSKNNIGICFYSKFSSMESIINQNHVPKLAGTRDTIKSG